MWEKFFITESESRKAGYGFEMFTAPHFIWLGVLILLGFLICLAYAKTPAEKRRRVELTVGLSILGLNLIRAAWLIATGEYDVGYLPLHLCGMSVYIEAFNAVKPNKLTREIMFAASMPGAFMALVTPNWNVFPAFSFYIMCCYLLHGLLVIYPLMLLIGGDFRPTLRRLPLVVLFLVAVSVPVYFFDVRFGRNFMFLRWPPSGTPLVWFEEWLGNPGYLVGFLVIAAALWLVLYAPFTIADAVKRRRVLQTDTARDTQ